MNAKVKGQGHKVTHDENAQSAENLVNATISKWLDIVKIIAQYTYIVCSNATISQDMFNQCPWTFRSRIRLMNLPRSPFSLKADLPVGCPYRFNSSYFYSNIDPTLPKGPRKQTTEPILGTALLEKKKPSYNRLNGKAWLGLLPVRIYREIMPSSCPLTQ